MSHPVYFYYQLNNFYQNHRIYVKSKSADQLDGSNLSIDDVNSDCYPIVTMNDLGRTKELLALTSSYLADNYNSTTVVANPCGLIAKTFFNDSYSMYNSATNVQVNISETDIAWPSDKEKKFKKLNLAAGQANPQ